MDFKPLYFTRQRLFEVIALKYGMCNVDIVLKLKPMIFEVAMAGCCCKPHLKKLTQNVPRPGGVP